MVEQQIVDSKKFTIFYDAKESNYEKHKIDAYTLGTSILELSKMLNTADKIINREKTIDLLVTAPVKEGSVAVQFVVDFLNNGGVDVLKYLGLTAASATIASGPALAVAQRIKDKRVIGVTTTTNSNVATIELDGEIIECDKTVAELVTNPTIRQAMNEVITQPLLGKEEPIFRVEIDDIETLRLTNQDVLNFKPLTKDSLVSEEVKEIITTNVKLTQINFTSKNGWKMIYDEEEKSVTINDQSFLNRIQDNALGFKEGDMFEVELEIVQKNTAKSKRTQYIISRVIRHRASEDRKLV